jgi:uncharacterized protein (TIGR03118 family)
MTDPVLQNPWGLTSTASGGSPFWISDNVPNLTTLYGVTGGTNVTKAMPMGTNGNIAIPTTAAGPQGPTGAVANTNTSSFPVLGNGANGASAHFIFANLNGTISAWNAGQTAFTQVTTPGAVYTGLAINAAQTQLYAVNNATGRIDVFNSSFAPMTNGAFTTPAAISSRGLVPFNVQPLSNGNVAVTYAPPTRAGQTGATAGMGAVVIFDATGTTVIQTIVGKPLAAPWGIALAPPTFGQFANDLLVGNFSYLVSEINAFDPATGKFLGTIPIDPGMNQTSGGLWALVFGNSGMNGGPNTLFFTDGINGEMNGLFGAIDPVPLPATLPLFASGLGALGLLGWRRKRRAQAVA